MWENGAYHCWSYPDDRDHRKRIYELAGEKSGRTKNWSNSFNGNLKNLLGTLGTGKLYSSTNRVKKGKKIIIQPIFTNKFKTPVPSVPTEEKVDHIDNPFNLGLRKVLDSVWAQVDISSLVLANFTTHEIDGVGMFFRVNLYGFTTAIANRVSRSPSITEV